MQGRGDRLAHAVRPRSTASARSTTTTPSVPSSFLSSVRSAATSSASLVLPTPPGPVTVTAACRRGAVAPPHVHSRPTIGPGGRAATAPRGRRGARAPSSPATSLLEPAHSRPRDRARSRRPPDAGSPASGEGLGGAAFPGEGAHEQQVAPLPQRLRRRPRHSRPPRRRGVAPASRASRARRAAAEAVPPGPPPGPRAPASAGTPPAPAPATAPSASNAPSTTRSRGGAGSSAGHGPVDGAPRPRGPESVAAADLSTRSAGPRGGREVGRRGCTAPAPRSPEGLQATTPPPGARTRPRGRRRAPDRQERPAPGAGDVDGRGVHPEDQRSQYVDAERRTVGGAASCGVSRAGAGRSRSQRWSEAWAATHAPVPVPTDRLDELRGLGRLGAQGGHLAVERGPLQLQPQRELVRPADPRLAEREDPEPSSSSGSTGSWRSTACITGGRRR